MVPDVLGLLPSSWAECCAPVSGMTGAAVGRLHGAAGRRRGVGRVRARRSEQADLDRRALGKHGRRAAAGASRRRRSRRDRTSRSRPRCRTCCWSATRRRRPPRRHRAEERDRRDARRQRLGHLHQQRQGRVDHADRPDRDDQQRRARSSSEEGATRCLVSSFTSAPGAVLARGTGDADRAEPARHGQRAADGDDRRAVRRRRLHVSAAARRQRSLRQRAVGERHHAGDCPTVSRSSCRAARRSARRPARLCSSS